MTYVLQKNVIDAEALTLRIAIHMNLKKGKYWNEE